MIQFQHSVSWEFEIASSYATVTISLKILGEEEDW